VLDEELVPRTDRSLAIVSTRAHEGSTIEYMDQYQVQVEQILKDVPDVRRYFSAVALGLGTPGLVNQGRIWASLVDADERKRSQREVVEDIGARLRQVAGIEAWAFEPSPMRGVGGSGLNLRILGEDLQRMADIGEALKRRVGELPGYGHADVNIYLNKPQLEVEIDRERASDLGVSVRDIATTLQILLGGRDLSTFKLRGETYDVMAQLERGERNDPRDLLELSVRTQDGGLVPLSGLVDLRETTAPRAIYHFDRLRSANFSVQLDGVAQGEAIETVGAIARELLPLEGGYRVRLAGNSEKFVESGNALAFAYGLAILIVYLVLAAQFESFVHPLTILVAVALSFTGALVTLAIVGWLNDRGVVQVVGSLNIYSKIGLVMLIGLVTKNSILIVEFANQLRGRGYALVDATVEAARTRFRPILMTALATMVGILPIALGQGAGGDARAPLGIAVVGGMFFSTGLTFLIVPAAYVVMERAQLRLRGRAIEPEANPSTLRTA
jgi:multidrug efflux pump